MKKMNWTSKLTNRKFWLSIASFVAILLVTLGHSEETATQIASLIMAGAAIIVYLIDDGLTDAGNAGDGTDDSDDVKV